MDFFIFCRALICGYLRAGWGRRQSFCITFGKRKDMDHRVLKSRWLLLGLAQGVSSAKDPNTRTRGFLEVLKNHIVANERKARG
jgi:hypothetical protein